MMLDQREHLLCGTLAAGAATGAVCSGSLPDAMFASGLWTRGVYNDRMNWVIAKVPGVAVDRVYYDQINTQLVYKMNIDILHVKSKKRRREEATRPPLQLRLGSRVIKCHDQQAVLIVEEHIVPLTPVEYQIVRMLLEHYTHTVSLAQQQDTHMMDPNLFVSFEQFQQRGLVRHSVIDHASRAARKLEAHGFSIANVGSRGYVLILLEE